MAMAIENLTFTLQKWPFALISADLTFMLLKSPYFVEKRNFKTFILEKFDRLC
jgi:hypothetical protein